MKKSKNIATFASLMPQEEMLEVKKNSQSLYIGIPKETSYQENRVSLSPDAVALLVSNGHKIVIEKGAGVNANFSDEDYSDSGAIIAYNIKDVYEHENEYTSKLRVPVLNNKVQCNIILN